MSKAKHGALESSRSSPLLIREAGGRLSPESPFTRLGNGDDSVVHR